MEGAVSWEALYALLVLLLSIFMLNTLMAVTHRLEKNRREWAKEVAAETERTKELLLAISSQAERACEAYRMTLDVTKVCSDFAEKVLKKIDELPRP